MSKMKHMELIYKINTRDPRDIIEFINTYPLLKGMCYHEDKLLKSKDPDKVQFYFDPYHGVLSIKYSDSFISQQANELIDNLILKEIKEYINSKPVAVEKGLYKHLMEIIKKGENK